MVENFQNGPQPPARAISQVANNPHFTVLDEGPGFLVVDKPAPLLVHPTRPGGAPTLWDGLRSLLAFELANGGQISLVNRLDRETSGVTLVATTRKRAREFGLAMQRRQIEKRYLALSWGWPAAEEFEIAAPILRRGDVSDYPIHVKQTVHPDGVACRTGFRVRSRHTGVGGVRFSLIEAQPFTGRMHQIRVHLHHAGFPVVGDKLYGPNDACYLEFIETGWTEALERRLILPRQALHSWKLTATVDGKSLTWEAPVPPEFMRVAETGACLGG